MKVFIDLVDHSIGIIQVIESGLYLYDYFLSEDNKNKEPPLNQ